MCGVCCFCCKTQNQHEMETMRSKVLFPLLWCNNNFLESISVYRRILNFRLDIYQYISRFDCLRRHDDLSNSIQHFRFLNSNEIIPPMLLFSMNSLKTTITARNFLNNKPYASQMYMYVHLIRQQLPALKHSIIGAGDWKQPGPIRFPSHFFSSEIDENDARCSCVRSKGWEAAAVWKHIY